MPALSPLAPAPPPICARRRLVLATPGGSALADGGDRVIGPMTPENECEVYAVVMAIRFLERAAYDTLSRLVDPRGGYLLLSTFVEEEEACKAPFACVPNRPSLQGQEHSKGVEAGLRAGISAPDRREEENRGVKGAGGGAGPEEAGVRGIAARGNGRKAGGSRLSRSAAREAAAKAIMTRWPHKSPRDPKRILRRGELAKYFTVHHGFEVVVDTVERLPDGRPIACFLARKVRAGAALVGLRPRRCAAGVKGAFGVFGPLGRVGGTLGTHGIPLAKITRERRDGRAQLGLLPVVRSNPVPVVLQSCRVSFSFSLSACSLAAGFPRVSFGMSGTVRTGWFRVMGWS